MKQDTRGSLKNMEALLETLSIRKASQIQSKAVIIVFSCNMSSSVPQVKCRVTLTVERWFKKCIQEGRVWDNGIIISPFMHEPELEDCGTARKKIEILQMYF